MNRIGQFSPRPGEGDGLPPIAVLPDPDFWPEPSEALQTTADAAQRTAAALVAVAPFEAPMARDHGLRQAYEQMTALHDLLDRDHPLAGAENVEPLSPIQSYFRLRQAVLNCERIAITATRVLAWSLADLRVAPLAGSDLERSCAAMQQAVIDIFALTDGHQRGAADATAVDTASQLAAEPTVPDREALWQARWLTGHHLHALFNVLAAVALGQATEALRSGRAQSAVTHLKRATTYVEGFPAARAQSLAFPAAFYNLVLRPSMLPPLVPAPLSGKMHIEYQRYQAGIDALLDVCPEPIDALASRHLTVALARETLLEADLVDAERHACLVEPLVGPAKSLAQHARTKDNAVSVLRRIHGRRSTRYAPFMRFTADHYPTPAS